MLWSRASRSGEIEKSCTTKVAGPRSSVLGAAIFDLGSSAARQQHERQAADHRKSPLRLGGNAAADWNVGIAWRFGGSRLCFIR